MNPIIGVVGRYNKLDDKYGVFTMSEKIRLALVKSDAIPILIVPSDVEEYAKEKSPILNDIDKEKIIKVIDMCDAIVIPGTNKLYDYDKFIFEYASLKNIPILGICGGMQLIGISNGHKEYLQKIDNGVNHSVEDKKYVHNINIKNNTKLYDIIGKNSIQVNSRHLMELKKVDDYIISATSDDGVIEAIEHPSKPILGVQWHPESLMDDENNSKVFKYLVKISNK